MRALWFGLLGAPTAWSLQLISAYAFTAHKCFPRLTSLAVPAPGSVSLFAILAMISVAAVATGILALGTALGSHRVTAGETEHDTHGALDVGEGRTRFMALSGVLVSLLFLVAVLGQASLVLSLEPCTQMTYISGEVYH